MANASGHHYPLHMGMELSGSGETAQLARYELIAICLLLIGLSPQISAAEELRVNGIAYKNVQILSVVNGEIVFRMAGNTIRKPLNTVWVVSVSGETDLVKAEDWMAQGRTELALPLYQAVLTRSRPDWMKDLAKQRMESAKSGTTKPKQAEVAAEEPVVQNPAVPDRKVADGDSPPELRTAAAFRTFIDSFPADKSSNDWAKKVGEWRKTLNGFRGKVIRWTVTIDDASTTPQGVRVRTAIKKDFVLAGVVLNPTDGKIAQAGKGSTAEITGRISRFFAKKANEQAFRASGLIDPTSTSVGIELSDLSVKMIRLVAKVQHSTDHREPSAPDITPPGWGGGKHDPYPGWTGPRKICPACNATGFDAEAQRKNMQDAGILGSRIIGTGGSGRARIRNFCSLCGGMGMIPDLSRE